MEPNQLYRGRLIDHVQLVVKDLAASRRFYVAAFGVLGIVLLDGIWVVLAASVTGFSLAVTFVVTFALPPVLAPQDDVHRMAGGMFAISYAIAVVIPVLCGAIWDLTGVPWTVFLPVGVCALTLTTLGIVLTRRNPEH